MIGMSVGQLAAAVGGDPVGDPSVVVAGPTFVDSRASEPGSLFAAIVGERVDGHDFVGDAARHGAVAALVSRPVDVLPCVVVVDVVDALARLAGSSLADLRRGGHPRVVGITGSSGKTSTKDLLAQLLRRHGPTVAPTGSFNNEIGLPLTVLRAGEGTRYLVLEMSARGVGHIAHLCRVAPVDVGVVLNVGSAHVGEFGSRQAIATAKAELVAGVVDDGVTVLNADDDLVAAMAGAARGRVVTFGRSPHADVRAERVDLDPQGRASFALRTPAGDADVRLALVGGHHVSNALAAAAAALECGMSVADVAAGLAEAVAVSRWRMEMGQTADGVTVINDAYNANPESMRAALETLVHVGRAGATWAVVGAMAELGAATDDEHRAVGRACGELGVDHVVTVGVPAVAEAARAAGAEVTECDDASAAAALVAGRAAPGDTVLVKASRAAGLERVAAALLGPGEAA